MSRIFDLFVPGRVCLFGEHSDWAGGYRRFNSAIPPGHVIIAGTNQGLHARARARAGSLVLRSVLPDTDAVEETELPMQRDALLREAQAGGFFSYAAGVAFHMLTFYEVDGLELDNYRTTLPIRKGLSSSAALCVLVARAFNRAYDLKLTTRAEMESAYQGEILTPSRCGRMDQGCAFGQVPVHMTFDGDFLKARRLNVARPLCLLIADLNGSKDTIRILADLSRAYPFASDTAADQVQAYLGARNTEIVKQATTALGDGDAAALGVLMTQAQAEFDAHLIPACPQELGAPKLHAALADPEVQALVFGGKGVGSQGDGCVQFVARDEAARDTLAAYLSATYGMTCFPLDLRPPRAVTKAVIPAAGFGTRLFPATKAVKKELFPLITPTGEAKPIIVAIIEEAIRSGIEEIALIIQPDDEALFRELFHTMPPPELYNRLPERARQACHELQQIGERVTLITQDEQEGFGHAVLCARDWVGDAPFLLLLGDHIYLSTTQVPCARQLIDAFEAHDQRSVVGLYVAKASTVSNYGTVTGTWADDDKRVLEIGELAEKPSIDYARHNLVTPGLGRDRFLCVYGQYVLTPTVFAKLQEAVDNNQRQAGEIQLTTALEAVRRDTGMLGCVVQGEHFDTGLPATYLRSIMAYHTAKPTTEE